jgi:hypothetical protein
MNLRFAPQESGEISSDIERYTFLKTMYPCRSFYEHQDIKNSGN